MKWIVGVLLLPVLCVACGGDSPTDPQNQTGPERARAEERLLGHWSFVYEVGDTTFTDEYNLVRVEESVSEEGELFVVGNDRFGIVAAAVYSRVDQKYTLSGGLESVLNFFYLFDIMTDDKISGEVFLFGPGENILTASVRPLIVPSGRISGFSTKPAVLRVRPAR